jgi:energy-coupling factor transport system ATP-binding protein
MDGTPHEIFARVHELQAVGLNVPLVTRVARHLHTHGVALPEAVLTAEELVVALSQDGGRRTNDGRGGDRERGRPGEGETGRGGDKGTTKGITTDNGQQTTDASQIQNPKSKIQNLIEVRDLHYTYLAGTPLAQEALRGVDCAVYEGETLAILGGTQAGKSTLIEFFNALRLPPPGHVLFAGQDVAAPGFDLDRLRQSVGIVFQQPETQLFEDTVGKDVSYAPRRKQAPPAESRAIVEQALNDVGLDYETFRLRYVYALSGGQKRRVAIAGVLAAQPRVLILDEPVAGLDPRGRADLAALIIDLTRRLGLTVILVGNAVDELAQLANRAIVMSQGRVVMEGTLHELLRRADELHALGLELSEPAEIALTLRPLFPDIPTDLLRAEELEEALLKRLEIGDWIVD